MEEKEVRTTCTSSRVRGEPDDGHGGPVVLEVVLKGAVAACSKDSSTFSGESKFFVDKLAFVPMWLRFDS